MTRDELKQLSNTTFLDNTTGDITPDGHRQFNNELIDSMATVKEVQSTESRLLSVATNEADRAVATAKSYTDTVANTLKFMSLRFAFSTTTNQWTVTLLDSNLESLSSFRITLAKHIGSESVTVGNITYKGVNWYGPSIQASLGKNLNYVDVPWDNAKMPFRIEVPYDGIDGPGNARKLNVVNLMGRSADFIFSVNISCIFK